MSRKLFNFAMEDEEELDLEGTDSQKDSSTTPTPEEQTRSDPVPDNKVADLSELNVVKLAKAATEAQDEELHAEYEMDSKEASSALADMETLLVAQECLANCLTTKHRGALNLSQKIHSDYRNKHGLGPMRKTVSLEAYETQESVELAMESIADTVRTVITAIIAAIKKALAYTKIWFKTYFSKTNLCVAGLNRAHVSFVKFRKENGKLLKSYYEKHGIDSTTFIQGFSRKAILSIDGKQPGDGTLDSVTHESYVSAFKAVSDLLQVNELLTKYVDKGFLATFEAVEQALSDGKYPEQSLIFFDPRAVIPPTYGTCFHVNGLTQQPDTKLYCSPLLLGGKTAVVQVTNVSVGDAITNGMHKYAQWKMWLTSDSQSATTGTMRYVTNEEEEVVYSVLEKIGKQAMAFQKTTDQIDYVLDGMVDLLNKLSAGLSKNTDYSNAANSVETAKRIELARESVAAAQSICALNQSYLIPLGSYANGLMSAWYDYIRITLETENTYLQKARAEM